MKKRGRKERRKALQDLLSKDPFMTDWQLADELGVSIATIRLDRMALDIPELRERARIIAAGTYSEIKALHGEEVIGDLVELNPAGWGFCVGGYRSYGLCPQSDSAGTYLLPGAFLGGSGDWIWFSPRPPKCAIAVQSG